MNDCLGRMGTSAQARGKTLAFFVTKTFFKKDVDDF